MKDAAGQWVSAEGKTLNWVKAAAGEQVLWEPGCTYELTPFQIVNKGNLALKYKIVVTGLEGDSGLLKVITFTYKTADGAAFDINQEGHLTAKGTDKASTGLITLTGTMATTAGNDYMGKELKNITITVVATQDTVESDSFNSRYDNAAEYPEKVPTTVTVATAEELRTALTTLTDAGSGDNKVIINQDITLAEGETWTPITVDGYRGAGVITVEGNGHTISGLNNALFAGGFAGTSGIVIKDLTLDKMTINDSTNTQGIGAFICNVDSMPKIDLVNCHLTNSTITSTAGARVGGLVGWSSGYNKPNDGPVDTYVFNYPVTGDATGGMGYFAAFAITLFLAQCVNFPMQRNITFKSKGNVWYQIAWYVVAFVLITIVCSFLMGIYVPLCKQFFPPALYNVLITVINGGVQMVIYFPIYKIIFPEGEQKKN